MWIERKTCTVNEKLKVKNEKMCGTCVDRMWSFAKCVNFININAEKICACVNFMHVIVSLDNSSKTCVITLTSFQNEKYICRWKDAPKCTFI